MPSDPILGEIMLFAGNYAPRQWALCQGTVISVSQYQALFSLISNYYGGDGRTNFALPDFRGRAPVHFGSGPGLTPYSIGQKFGVETVTLTVNQIPAHKHTARAINTDGDQTSPIGNIWAKTATGAFNEIYKTTAPGTQIPNPVDMSDITIQNTGGSQPHTNISPFIAMNYCIALKGVYPSRN